MKIEFVDTFVVTAAENSFPMLTTLPSYATREPAGPYNRSPFIFSRGSCFRCDPRNAETRAKVKRPKRYQVQAGKVTVPLSRVPCSPGSRQTGSRLIHRRRFRYYRVSTIFLLSLSLPISFSLSLVRSLARSLAPSAPFSPRTFCAQHSRRRIGRERFSIGSWKNWRKREREGERKRERDRRNLFFFERKILYVVIILSSFFFSYHIRVKRILMSINRFQNNGSLKRKRLLKRREEKWYG